MQLLPLAVEPLAVALAHDHAPAPVRPVLGGVPEQGGRGLQEPVGNTQLPLMQVEV